MGFQIANWMRVLCEQNIKTRWYIDRVKDDQDYWRVKSRNYRAFDLCLGQFCNRMQTAVIFPFDVGDKAIESRQNFKVCGPVLEFFVLGKSAYL